MACVSLHWHMWQYNEADKDFVSGERLLRIFSRECLGRIEKSNLEIGKMEILYLGKHYPKMFRQKKRKKYKGKYSKIIHVELIYNINLGD